MIVSTKTYVAAVATVVGIIVIGLVAYIGDPMQFIKERFVSKAPVVEDVESVAPQCTQGRLILSPEKEGDYTNCDPRPLLSGVEAFLLESENVSGVDLIAFRKSFFQMLGTQAADVAGVTDQISWQGTQVIGDAQQERYCSIEVNILKDCKTGEIPVQVVDKAFSS